jgi:hypothetical protein
VSSSDGKRLPSAPSKEHFNFVVYVGGGSITALAGRDSHYIIT